MGMLTIRQISQSLLKPIVIVLVLAMAVGLFFIAPQFGGASSGFVYRGPYVRVNGVSISNDDFQKHIETAVGELYQQYGGYYQQIPEEQVRENALQYAIRSLVIRSLVDQYDIKIDNSEVDFYFNRWAKQYPTKAERQGYYNQVGLKNDADCKRQIRRELEEYVLYLTLAEQDKIDVPITEAEIAEAYATVSISHILLGTQETNGGLSQAEAKKRAEEVYAKLNADGDWDELVKEYSTDPGSKETGGEIGTGAVRIFKQQFADYGQGFIDGVLALPKGGHSAPLLSPEGYHVFKMTNRIEATGKEYENRHRMIKAELVYNKFLTQNDHEDYNKWITARIEEAKVDILDPALRAYQLRVKGQWAEAAKLYEKAVKSRQHRNDRDVFVAAVRVFIHEQDWDAAVQYGRKILKRFPTDMEIMALLGQAMYKKGQDDEDENTTAEGRNLLSQAETAAVENRDMGMMSSISQIYSDLELTKESEALTEKLGKLYEEQMQQYMESQMPIDEEGALDDTAAGTNGTDADVQ